MRMSKTIDFDEVFYYAEEYFGVDWNPCNDLFFHTIFAYGSVSDIYLSDLCAYFDNYVSDNQVIGRVKAMTKEEFDVQCNDHKSRIIMIRFMADRKLTKISVDCR